MQSERLEPGDRVAICLRNGVEWVCFDQAALGLGLVVVPLYTNDSPDNMAHVVCDSGAQLLVLDRASQWSALAPHRPRFPGLRRVVCLRQDQPSPYELIRPLADWLPDDSPAVQTRVEDPDALATLVYTSGTTGPPKGVMLSHRNILWNAEAVLRRIPALPSDVFLSFLPLAHSFERTVGYYLPMMAGSRVSYARSIEELRRDLLVVRPTVLLSVPRVYDKIYAAVQARLADSGLRRRLFQSTVDIGWQRFRAAQGKASPPPLLRRLAGSFLRRFVAQPVLKRLGGRMRVCVSGGAPLSAEVARFFLGLGVPLTEGYGLTEASPVISGNAPQDCVPGAVGQPLPEIQVRIGPSGELLVRGPNRMLGYWQQPEATRQAIDADGWLHTGDMAEIRDGNIFIRGRLKEVLVTSTGEKVPPGDMEMAITADPLFDQAIVIGDGRPYLAALLVLNPQSWRQVAGNLGLDSADPVALRSPVATKAALVRVQKCLKSFPGYAQVRAVHLMLEPWTVDNGLITPTMKVKRPQLEARFAEQIKRLYKGRELPGARP